MLNDGLYGNSNSWLAVGKTNEWVQIKLSRTTTVSTVVYSRDRDRPDNDRMPTHFKIQTSLDGKRWTTAREVNGAPRPGGQ